MPIESGLSMEPMPLRTAFEILGHMMKFFFEIVPNMFNLVFHIDHFFVQVFGLANGIFH